MLYGNVISIYCVQFGGSNVQLLNIITVSFRTLSLPGRKTLCLWAVTTFTHTKILGHRFLSLWLCLTSHATITQSYIVCGFSYLPFPIQSCFQHPTCVHSVLHLFLLLNNILPCGYTTSVYPFAADRCFRLLPLGAVMNNVPRSFVHKIFCEYVF